MFVAASVAAYSAHRRGVPPPVSLAALGCGALLLCLAYVAPSVVRPIDRAWSVFGQALGKITTPVLLVVMFAAVLLPTRLLLVLLGKDPLERRRDPARASYWTLRTRPTLRKEDFERLS